MISHPDKLVAVKVINRGTVQETSQLRQEVGLELHHRGSGHGSPSGQRSQEAAA